MLAGVKCLIATFFKIIFCVHLKKGTNAGLEQLEVVLFLGELSTAYLSSQMILNPSKPVTEINSDYLTV